MKKIAVLGSTGSVGLQTLEVCRRLGGFEIAALSAHENDEALFRQIEELRPAAAVMINEAKAAGLAGRVRESGLKTEILSGKAGLRDVLAGDIYLCVNAVVGSAGLEPTLAALERGVPVALANKESLVCAGALVMQKSRENGARVIPVDSEHSAVFQCLEGNDLSAVEKIILTASGGPFRGYSRERLKTVTKADALRHPNWAMGAKITVDSATMMNKGLEVIEARWLFGVSAEKIEVAVHPQSIIHSMVQFADGAVLAQLGEPDMRVPIQYALTWPERAKNDFPRADFFGKTLTFEKPDARVFPCLGLALSALGAGGLVPAVMNAANETAVRKFLEEKISFADIPRIVESAMNAYTVSEGGRDSYTLEEALAADSWAREFAEGL